MATSYGVCYTTDVSIMTSVRPMFSYNFIVNLNKMDEAVKSNNETIQKQAYVQFAKDFGTHFIIKADFGASASVHRVYNKRSNSKYQQDNRQECLQTSTKFCLGVGAEGKVTAATVEACVGNEHQKCMAKKETFEVGYSFSSEQTIITTRGVGGTKLPA